MGLDMVLNGAELAGFIKQRHFDTVRQLARPPRLVDIQAGTDAATATYVRVKQRYASDIGVRFEHVMAEPATATLVAAVEQANAAADGVLVQLPLPPEVDAATVIGAIDPAKDVDGLRPGSPFAPATAEGVMWLLGSYGVAVRGQRAVVVGQGAIGRAVADLLETAGAEVTRADEHTDDLAARTRSADIVVSAVGWPRLIRAEMLKDGAAVIDVGTSFENGRQVGDVDPAVLESGRFKVTPNPGGVGPMTVAVLFEHLLSVANQAQS